MQTINYCLLKLPRGFSETTVDVFVIFLKPWHTVHIVFIKGLTLLSKFQIKLVIYESFHHPLLAIADRNTEGTVWFAFTYKGAEALNLKMEFFFLCQMQTTEYPLLV